MYSLYKLKKTVATVEELHKSLAKREIEVQEEVGWLLFNRSPNKKIKESSSVNFCLQTKKIIARRVIFKRFNKYKLLKKQRGTFRVLTDYVLLKL